jgi:hypothetical protein
MLPSDGAEPSVPPPLPLLLELLLLEPLLEPEPPPELELLELELPPEPDPLPEPEPLPEELLMLEPEPEPEPLPEPDPLPFDPEPLPEPELLDELFESPPVGAWLEAAQATTIAPPKSASARHTGARERTRIVVSVWPFVPGQRALRSCRRGAFLGAERPTSVAPTCGERPRRTPLA